MKKTLSLFTLLFVVIGMFGQTNLFNPATASVESTYFATGPNWETETSSSASYDPNTGTLLVDLKSQFSSQWQAQVKLQHNMVFDPAKQYTLSIKFHATDAVGDARRLCARASRAKAHIRPLRYRAVEDATWHCLRLWDEMPNSLSFLLT